MNHIAIIPLRAGSKGIPKKNKKKLLGRPLFTWILTEAIYSRLTKVVVYSDDPEILEYVQANYSWSDKLSALQRSQESAADQASTEMAMREFAEKINYDFDSMCLLQATSPLNTRENINEAIEKLNSGDFDSVLSVVNTKRFVWNKDGSPLNYDYLERPRRQDFNGLLIENGAIYIASRESFRKSQNRLGGKIGLVEMPEDTLTEIDEEHDFVILEELLKKRLQKPGRGYSRIKALVLDVDGVFTDASLSVTENGEFSKTFSVRDGMGLSLLRDAGIDVVVMTAENSTVVARRMEKLDIQDTYLNVKDKYAFLEHLIADRDYDRNQIAYLGDDINDMSNILSCGMGMCPNDADPAILRVADVVLNKEGGKRVIREACEFILKHNQRF